jgi:hypothetical protein
MTSSHTAQGLASLGRNGDTMLMHVSPSEVGGLKQVGDSLGIKMTTNPYTGMPEAFNFGDFFTSFLPTIAGIAAAPATGGFSMAPILAGAGTGAALAAAKGQDPLMGGLTGGLGGYGGGQLAPTFGSMSTAGSNAITNKVATDAAYAGSLGGMQAVAQPGGYAGITSNLGAGLTPGASGAIANPMAVNAATPSFGSQMLSQAQTNLGNTVSAGKDFLSSPSTAYKAFTDAGGTAMDLAMPVGTAVLSGMEPPTYAGYQDPDKDKYRGPQGQLNLSDKFDTGLRLVAEGGYIDGYATGGTIQSGGIRDLYGTPDNQPTISPGLSGFGLGRLNNLAGEQAMTQAQTLGYADGGDVVAGERGMNLDKQRALNLDLVPSLNVETGKQNYTTPESFMYNFYTGNIPSDSLGPLGQLYSYTMKGKLNDGSTVGQNLYDDMMKSRSKMAKGGYLDGAGDGMSDSIPATIEGKQPARLADGEFVIPADVVSHIGNGSSKAGSKRLYAMLDKVRHARTGNKKQGKQINPAKYMPA